MTREASSIAGNRPLYWNSGERIADGAVRWVERLEAPATTVTGEVLAIALDFPAGLVPAVVHRGDVQHTAAQIQAGFDGVGDSAALAGTHHHPINDHLDEVLAAMVDR